MRTIDPDIVPADFEVQPVDPDDPTVHELATCGTCGLSWDDGVPTTWTPAPSGRCPFEYFHPEPVEELSLRLYVRLGNDAVQTGHDLARTLRGIADALETLPIIDGPVHYRTIFDANGNDVGRYGIKLVEA